MIFSKFIREKKSVYKFLQLEQEGERLNKILNELETKYKNIKNKAYRYFKMKEDLENMNYISMEKFKSAFIDF